MDALLRVGREGIRQGRTHTCVMRLGPAVLRSWPIGATRLVQRHFVNRTMFMGQESSLKVCALHRASCRRGQQGHGNWKAGGVA